MAVSYLVTMLRTLAKKISAKSGKEVTDKDVLEEIKLRIKGVNWLAILSNSGGQQRYLR